MNRSDACRLADFAVQWCAVVRRRELAGRDSCESAQRHERARSLRTQSPPHPHSARACRSNSSRRDKGQRRAVGGLERNDFSRWPTGIYARSYVRDYAAAIGVDPESTVDEFCRWFPQGDRRAEPTDSRTGADRRPDKLEWRDAVPPHGRRRRRSPRARAAAQAGRAAGRPVSAFSADVRPPAPRRSVAPDHAARGVDRRAVGELLKRCHFPVLGDEHHREVGVERLSDRRRRCNGRARPPCFRSPRTRAARTSTTSREPPPALSTHAGGLRI